MSEYMLNDDDAINDVNPFVTHDFSLPGGVRETGDFADFVEMEKTVQIPVKEKSVFCSTGLCKDLCYRKHFSPSLEFGQFFPFQQNPQNLPSLAHPLEGKSRV